MGGTEATRYAMVLLQAMFNENVIGIWAVLITSALLGTTFYAVVAAVERAIVFWGAEQ